MSFILIEGTFHVKSYSPDGDSVRFEAKNVANWKKLSGPRVELNAKKHAQLRIEAIDALETHYGTQNEMYHQPVKYAKAAIDYLLFEMGITNVEWNKSGKVIKADDGTKGYILTRSTDKFKRPVSFVFAGETDLKDGGEVFLDKDALKKSLNYKSIAEGLSYPTYYNGLFSDLRTELTTAANRARSDKKGFWPFDKTNSGFAVPDLKPLQEDVVILPKLFRRIVDFMGDGGPINGFKDYLERKCEPLIKISQVHFTRFDNVVEVNGNKVKLMEAPDNLIFVDPILCKERYQFG